MRRRTFIAGLGAAAVWPLAAQAQQATLPLIGYLSAGNDTASPHLAAAFRRGFAEEGYVDGQNVKILYRFAEAHYDRLPALAQELVQRRVMLIATTGGPGSVQAAKSATKTIPIVFQTGEDPVESGLVASLNRPGANLTGVTFLVKTLTAKRVELLHEMIPTARSVGYLLNSTRPGFKVSLSETQSAARVLGLHLTILPASTPNEIDTAFATIGEQRIEAITVDGDPLFAAQRIQLSALSAKYAVPAIFAYRESVDVGGLMSYGASLADAYRLAGSYAGRILKGEKPAELPVQQSTKVELIINLKTAKALGITVPLSLLGRADEVIE